MPKAANPTARNTPDKVLRQNLRSSHPQSLDLNHLLLCLEFSSYVICQVLKNSNKFHFSAKSFLMIMNMTITVRGQE